MPSRLKRLAISVALGLVWVVVGVVAWSIHLDRRYAAAYRSIHLGDSIATVIHHFGQPSSVDSHSPGSDRYRCVDKCWLRFWYSLPLGAGIHPIAIDFDPQGTVVYKYRFGAP